MSKVLIVEDEEAIADIEKDYLELSGFEVTICKDGTSGLAEALDGENMTSAYLMLCFRELTDLRYARR